MKISIDKTVVDEMARAYALASFESKHGSGYLVASEAVGGMCKMYTGGHLEKSEVIWQDLGGTMSIVPLSTRNEEVAFLMSHHYYPGFDAKESKIVKVSKKNNQWVQEEVFQLPYLHRFDLINVEGATYIVFATLCTWKNAREDWTSPGHVFMGRYDRMTNHVSNIKLVIPNLTQNHGLSKIEVEGQEQVLISADDGIYRLYVEKGNYLYKKQYEISSSETLLLDLNHDGKHEVITIEPFHGDVIGIYGSDGQLGQRIEGETQFLHALWGGVVDGYAMFICGGRRGKGELILFYLNDGGELETYVIGSGGSANISVAQEGNCLTIISANNSQNEIVRYDVKIDGESSMESHVVKSR